VYEVPATNVPVTVAGELVEEEDKLIDGDEVKAKLVIEAPLVFTVKSMLTDVSLILVTPVITGCEGLAAP